MKKLFNNFTIQKMLNASLMIAIFMFFGVFTASAQTPGEVITAISAGFLTVQTFVFWLAVDVLHLTLNKNVEKLVSAVIAMLLGGLYFYQQGVNPLTNLGVWGLVMLAIGLIDNFAGIKITPINIIQELLKLVGLSKKSQAVPEETELS